MTAAEAHTFLQRYKGKVLIRTGGGHLYIYVLDKRYLKQVKKLFFRQANVFVYYLSTKVDTAFSGTDVRDASLTGRDTLPQRRNRSRVR